MNRQMRMMKAKTMAMALLGGCTATVWGQAATNAVRPAPMVDLAVTYTADRTNPVHGANQWLNGGSLELGAQAWHGFGAAVRLTGETSQGMGANNVPLNLILATFGPRWRLDRRRWSIYGEGLAGEANGFNGLFVGQYGVNTSANGWALQVGGGFDLKMSRHLGVRLADASWIRTTFPNGTTDVQNHLALGAGLVTRF